MFNEGALVFQQKASAFPAVALDPPRGAQVIDACAAPGSKTSQLAVPRHLDVVFICFHMFS